MVEAAWSCFRNLTEKGKSMVVMRLLLMSWWRKVQVRPTFSRLETSRKRTMRSRTARGSSVSGLAGCSSSWPPGSLWRERRALFLAAGERGQAAGDGALHFRRSDWRLSRGGLPAVGILGVWGIWHAVRYMPYLHW